jgi:phosphatidylinositol alpha-1,6-mannosyltransferase
VVRANYSVRSRWRTAASVVWFSFLTLNLLVREKPGVVYFGMTYPTGLIGTIVRLTGTPYVIQTYGSELIRPRSRMSMWLHRLVLKKAFRVIAISEWGKEVVSGMGVPPEQVVVIHPKIDVARFPIPDNLDEFKAREGLAGKRVILSVGRLSLRKGHALVIEALPQVLEKVPDALYVVVGTGPAEDDLRRLAVQRGVENSVKFVSYRDLANFYYACDVFILPSVYVPQSSGGDVEGFGIVYLEAGACGKPVIGANNGGIPDAVADGESGLLVETGSVEAIMDALERLLGDAALRERLGRQGRERVLREFALDRYQDDLRRLIFEPLERERRA